MAYYTGTINSATPAVAYMDAIHPQMQSGGLTFVETYTSGTDVTNIYKSPAGSNSLGIDYFIFINRPSTTGKVAWSISELYDVGTHLASKFAPYGLPTTANTDYSVAGTCLPSSTTSGASLNKTGGSAFIPASTAYTYYLNVNFERVIFGFANPLGALVTNMMGMVYVGIYESMVDSIASLPTLCVVNLVWHRTSVASSYLDYAANSGATTRDYGVTPTVSSTTINAGLAWLASTSTHYSGSGITQIGKLDYPSSSVNNRAYNGGSENETRKVCIGMQRGSYWGGFDVSNAMAIGVLKDVIWCNKGSGLSSIGGDTLAVTNFAGTVLNYVKPGAPYILTGIYWLPTQ